MIISPLVFTALPTSCIIVNANEEQKWDRPGNEGTVWLPPMPCDLSVEELPNSDFTLFRPRL